MPAIIDPYTEGYATYENDLNEDANPYDPGSDDCVEWELGWRDAKYESDDEFDYDGDE